MYVGGQNLSLCKLYLFYEKTQEEFLNETDVDRYFHHSSFHISQSQHRILGVSKGSYKKFFASKLFRFCNLTTQQRYILQEELNTSKCELSSVVDSLRDLLKAFDKESKCSQIPLSKPKIETGSTKSKKTISLLNTITISLNIQLDKFVYRSILETPIFRPFRQI